VAVEQGWSKEEALGSLMRKAGWDGSSSASNSSGGGRRFLRGRGGGSDADAAEGKKRPQQPWDGVQDFRAVRYQGLKAQAGYAEWMAWKRWVDARDGVETGA
jgi:AMME syndrome candidate gene 1 protein